MDMQHESTNTVKDDVEWPDGEDDVDEMWLEEVEQSHTALNDRRDISADHTRSVTHDTSNNALSRSQLNQIVGMTATRMTTHDARPPPSFTVRCAQSANGQNYGVQLGRGSHGDASLTTRRDVAVDKSQFRMRGQSDSEIYGDRVGMKSSHLDHNTGRNGGGDRTIDHIRIKQPARPKLQDDPEIYGDQARFKPSHADYNSGEADNRSMDRVPPNQQMRPNVRGKPPYQQMEADPPCPNVNYASRTEGNLNSAGIKHPLVSAVAIDNNIQKTESPSLRSDMLFPKLSTNASKDCPVTTGMTARITKDASDQSPDEAALGGVAVPAVGDEPSRKEGASAAKRRRLHSNEGVSGSPIVKLSSIMQRIHAGESFTFAIKGFIVTLMSALKRDDGRWSITAKLSDKTTTLDAALSDEVLTKLIGFSVPEMMGIKKSIKTSDQTTAKQLETKLRQGLANCQKSLIDLHTTMAIRVCPLQQHPLVVSVGTTEPEDFASDFRAVPSSKS